MARFFTFVDLPLVSALAIAIDGDVANHEPMESPVVFEKT